MIMIRITIMINDDNNDNDDNIDNNNNDDNNNIDNIDDNYDNSDNNSNRLYIEFISFFFPVCREGKASSRNAGGWCHAAPQFPSSCVGSTGGDVMGGFSQSETVISSRKVGVLPTESGRFIGNHHLYRVKSGIFLGNHHLYRDY